MQNIGIYLTDASFDKKSKISSISFLEKTTNKTNNIQTAQYKNIYDAEFEGIKICLKDAYKKFKHVVVVCDNKRAVFNAQKHLRKEMKLSMRFESSQFLWLPRDFLSEADFLTKNVDITKNKKIKLDNATNGSVFEVFLTKEDYLNLLLDSILKFRKENRELNYNDLSILNKVLNGELIDPIQNIELIREDLLKIIQFNPKEGRKNSNIEKIIELLYMV